MIACGVLGVVKPPGMTSHDLVRAVRSTFGLRKVGHLGTLDPPAAGVLPLAVGPATRLSALLLGLPKSYRAEVLFGLHSDTGDLAGTTVADSDVPSLNPRDVRRAVESLAGRHLQTPPAYSARKIRGKRLYELARRGRVSPLELASRAREVEVYRSRMVCFGFRECGPFAGHPFAMIDLCCSSGTYVRQMAVLLAAGLGTSGCLSFLVRTGSCGFELEDSLTVEELLAAPASGPEGIPSFVNCARAWRPAAAAVSFLDAVIVAPEAARRASCGALVRSADILAAVPAATGGPPCPGRTTRTRGAVRLLDVSCSLLALARKKGDDYKPYAVFAEGVLS